MPVGSGENRGDGRARPWWIRTLCGCESCAYPPGSRGFNERDRNSAAGIGASCRSGAPKWGQASIGTSSSPSITARRRTREQGPGAQRPVLGGDLLGSEPGEHERARRVRAWPLERLAVGQSPRGRGQERSSRRLQSLFATRGAVGEPRHPRERQGLLRDAPEAQGPPGARGLLRGGAPRALATRARSRPGDRERGFRPWVSSREVGAAGNRAHPREGSHGGLIASIGGSIRPRWGVTSRCEGMHVEAEQRRRAPRIRRRATGGL